MTNFVDTKENTRYELASLGDYSIQLQWAKTLVEILMLTIHKGDAIIGQVSAPMHSTNLTLEEKWEAFLKALRLKLESIDVSDDAEKSELDILWNRVSSLIFKIKDAHIIFEE